MASPNPHRTRVVPFDAHAIAQAAALIGEGQCVAVPTETVYGLAADATNGQAVARIYEAKARPVFNPLIVHVSSLEEAEHIALFNTRARDMAERFWPGPLTLVLPALPGGEIASLATAGLSTIAVRVPAHRAMRALLAACRRPLAAPSANASGRISPTTAGHVLATLDGRISLIIDDGATDLGLESTIVASGVDGVRLLRPGPVTHEELGLADVFPSLRIEAPGQLARHYSPSKELKLDCTTATPGTWLIGFGPVDGNASLSASGDLIEAAASLFACLHEADASLAATIAVAPIPHRRLGSAINDRLRRAATR